MRIIYNNLIDDLPTTSITVLASLDNYPYTNMQDQRLGTKWASNNSSPQTIIINFGSAVSISVAAILGHNIANGTTVKIEANSSNSWSSPPFSQTFTWDSNIMLKFFAPASYQYWRFYINQANLLISRIWLSNYISVSPSSLLDFTVTYKNSDTNIYGLHRQKFSDKGVVWRKIDMSFPDTPNAMITTLSSFIDSVGFYKSFIFCNFDDIRNYKLVEPMYCSLSEEIGFSHKERMRFGYSLSMEEDL